MNFKGPSSSRGAALIIALAFILLLAGLVIAFFSRSVTVRQIADSSANGSRANLFANGAVSAIIGDLKQEIAAGSVITTATTGTNVSTLYQPDFNNTAYNQPFAPCRVGTTGTLANLIKRSAYNQPFFSGTSYTAAATYPASSRAADLSTTQPSINARYISRARWNTPLLLPKSDPATTDTTPHTDFTAPDWILVARDGSNPKSIETAKSAGVVGRYAYTIYDEGGLLDINVAGYPTVTGTGHFSYKNALSYADLHQIPGISDLSSSRQDQVINALVGWRNYASAQASGTFPNYTISSGSNYVAAIAANNNGFLQISSTSVLNGHTDQLFTSRQQLKRFLLNGVAASSTERADLQNALQYLGTFSRDLNQPSFIPNPNRPRILAQGSGGNDAAGNEDGTAPVNPSFLTVRAQGAFTRAGGISAVTGEPLVKTRFPLSRLAWITYKGPSKDRGKADPDMQLLLDTHGLSWEFLQQGSADNIKKYFGLTWKADTDGQYKWFYNVHNGTSGTGDKGRILTLSEIAALGGNAHDPDFIELLKAGISAGSIAKASVTSGSASVPNGGYATDPINYQYNIDASTDYAIIQVAANIIDQYDVDGYPTRIVFDDGQTRTPALPKEFRGVEDQPYIYRIRYGLLKLRDAVASGSGVLTDVTANSSYAYQAPPAKLTDPGVMLLMAIPEVWNPHDSNNPLPSAASSLRPTNFRIAPYSGNTPAAVGSGTYSRLYPWGYAVGASKFVIVTGGSAVTKSGTGSLNLYSQGAMVSGPGAYFTHNSGGGASDVIAGSYNPYGGAVSPDSAVINFSIPQNGSSYFREPTMLVKPSGSGDDRAISLSLGSGGYYASDYTQIRGASWSAWSGGGFKSATPNPLRLGSGEPGYNASTVPDPGTYIGIPMGLFPLRWVTTGTIPDTATSGTFLYTANYVGVKTDSGIKPFSYCLQYRDQNNNWVTCDTKYTSVDPNWLICPVPSTNYGCLVSAEQYITSFTDPRTSRFGAPISGHVNSVMADSIITAVVASHPGAELYGSTNWTAAKSKFRGWIDPDQGITVSDRPDASGGFAQSFRNLSSSADWSLWKDPGWYLPYTSTGADTALLQRGLLSQNRADYASDGQKFYGDPYTLSAAIGKPQFYTDPDGVLRRAMGGYVSSGTSIIGLPMARAMDYASGNAPASALSSAQQFQSRPMVLNRPFRSVAELGYVFSGTPWKNLSFFTPESGDAPLLDLFCIQETNDPAGLAAGRVNLNTRQKPVMKAILAGAYRDEEDNFASGIRPIGTYAALGASEADQLGAALFDWTTGTDLGKGPLTNLSDLVGRWVSKQTISGSFTPALSANCNIDGSLSYQGFSGQLGDVFASLYTDNQTKLSMINIQRFREATIRALANVGTARVWNLMIDVIAQTGRYPSSAKTLANFTADGEQRYWVHLAIDRYTGEVLDRRIESVRE
ncbi:MAG: hypothetical protein ACFUZC_12000 [Chthoniobacteraceae bacterium]